MDLSLKDNYEKEIIEIWYSIKNIPNLQTYFERGFCLPENIKMDSTLIIGINPAYNESFESNEYRKLENYYQNNHSEGEVNLQFFSKMVQLMGEDKNWCHLDLLYYRETNQNEIFEILKSKEGLSFVYKQLMISKRIIESSKPKLIIVANSLARRFFGFDKNESENIWMDFTFEFDNQIGTHRILSNDELNDVPVFFTSMLSGQRALDRGSFQRLKWHIEKVNNIENSKISF